MKLTYTTYHATVKGDATPDLKRYGISLELPAGELSEEAFDLYHQGALDALIRKRAELEEEGKAGKWGGIIRVVLDATEEEREAFRLSNFEILPWEPEAEEKE